MARLVVKNTDKKYIGLHGEITIKNGNCAIHDNVTEGGNEINSFEYSGDNVLGNGNFYYSENGADWSGLGNGRFETMYGWYIVQNGDAGANATSAGDFGDDTSHVGKMVISSGSNRDLTGDEYVYLQQHFEGKHIKPGGKMTVSLKGYTRNKPSERLFAEVILYSKDSPKGHRLGAGIIEVTNNENKYASITFDVPQNTMTTDEKRGMYGSFRLWTASGEGHDDRTGGISRNSAIVISDIFLSHGKDIKKNIGYSHAEIKEHFNFMKQSSDVVHFLAPLEIDKTNELTLKSVSIVFKPGFIDLPNITFEVPDFSETTTYNRSTRGFVLLGRQTGNFSSLLRLNNWTAEYIFPNY